MVVVRAVARAEVATPVARIGLRDAAKVGADTDADQPLRLLAALSICGWLPHRGRQRIVLLGGVDHIGGALADEDGLVAPLNNEILALTHRPQVNLDDARSENVLGRPHRVHELACDGTDQRGHDEARGRGQEVDPRTPVRMADGQTVLAEVEGALRARCNWLGRVLRPPDRAEVFWRELGNGDDGGLLRIMPDVGAGHSRAGGELALGDVRLLGEGGLPHHVVVEVPVVRNAILVVRVTRMGGNEVLRVVHCGGPHCGFNILRVLCRGLLDEAVFVERLLGGRRVEVGVDHVDVDGVCEKTRLGGAQRHERLPVRSMTQGPRGKTRQHDYSPRKDPSRFE
mmetsp:Transcript_92766/g.188945  ORF Transcript_92766/g.188945 Transcript_92766/m.188945 type:complete len:341 (-) Transcript_92766:25-1047(-)